ncbi:MAG: carboxypeptidase-like regulatory domain-containing protein [Chitinophagaceae bacterium]|nr:carboxypeptidase-like regulatory domain-containing protein [Chitinophagaceae bacterium]
MKKVLSILTASVFSLSSFAQSVKSCQALDAITKEPIPFVVVYNKTTDKVIYSDESGVFFFNDYKKGDTIVMSCMSYVDTLITVERLSNVKQILLRRKDNQLREVVIGTEGKEEKTIPYLPKRSIITFATNMASEMAFKVKFSTEDADKVKKILKVKIRVKQASDNNPVRIHIYNVANNGMPGTDILNENIILSAKNIAFGQLVLDVSQFDVYTSQREVFVGLEWLGAIDIERSTHYSHLNSIGCYYKRFV